MKKVYKKIDIKKVNKNNLSNILEQFNSLSLNETEKNLEKTIKKILNKKIQ